METFTKRLFLGAALSAGLSLSVISSILADGHDHKMEKGHTKGDGHKHGSHEGHKDHKGHMKGDEHKGHKHHEGHKDAAGHDHGHESASAHAKHHPDPSHGGVVLEIGEHHGELVVKDGKVALFLSDHDGKAVAAKGFSAMAIILTSQGRVGPLKMVAKTPASLEAPVSAGGLAGARIIITLKDPHGHMTQARYQMP